MCGILGIFNSEKSAEKAKKALEIMQNRGRDNYGFWADGNTGNSDKLSGLDIKDGNIIAHCLHSVVGFVKQPINGRGILVTNCELYNWKELSKEYELEAENDAELFLMLIEDIGFTKAIERLSGDYAVAYFDGKKVFLARDLLGVKPLWYSCENGFSFASEKKSLYFANTVRELNPREVICYDVKSKITERLNREFLKVKEANDKEIEERLIESVKIRLPEQKFGILFSGGLDSALVAKICKDLKGDFTCYTAAFSENSPDIVNAKKAAELLGVKLKYQVITKDEAEELLRIVVPLIEDSNVSKVGVAMTLFAACKLASEDKIKVIFSGSGADELFSGYHRHKTATDLKKDIYSDLLKVYEKNTYRDDVVAMANNLEVRVPFLDKELAELALGALHSEPGSKALLR